MAIRWEAKRPDEVRDYRHDWSAFLGDDTIADSEWDASGVTIDSDTNDDGSVTVWLSGGSGVARLTNTIATAGGRTESETFTLLVRENGEPVTLAETKLHLRVTDDSEDSLILSLITAAREYVENYTGHILVQREVTDSYDRFVRYLELTKRPYVGPVTVTYIDTDGAEQTYAEPFVADARYPVRVYPAHNDWWPSIRTNTQVRISYVAGYAEGEVPQTLVQAMLLLIGHWFGNRESVNIGNITSELPFTVEALLNQFRTPGL